MAEIKHEYIIAFIFAISHSFRNLPDDRLNFFHEENPWSDLAMAHFSHLLRQYPDLSATLTFGAKNDFPPLQCADVFAYEGFKQLQYDPTLKKVRKTWKVINSDRANVLVKAMILDEPKTEKSCEVLVDWFDRIGEKRIESSNEGLPKAGAT